MPVVKHVHFGHRAVDGVLREQHAVEESDAFADRIMYDGSMYLTFTVVPSALK